MRDSKGAVVEAMGVLGAICCLYIIPLLLVLYVLTLQFLHNTRDLPPAPFPSLPVIGHLHLLIKKPIYRTLNRYGPVMFLHFGSRPVLVASSPSEAEECLSKNDVVFANRPRLLLYKWFGYNNTSLVWSSYGDHWRNLRRISTVEVLSTPRLQMLSAVRLDEVLLAAGTETSVNKMEWALSLLLNHPQVLNFSEQNESDVANLPFLRGIINETLRMYPPDPLMVPHESSKDCTVEGYHIPRGTMLYVNLWAINNDPKIWAHLRKFDPDRFEKLESEKHEFNLMPFGSGRRGCPGEGLGLRVIGLVLGSLIQCFEWERPGEEMVDMTEGIAVSMPKAQHLLAKCRPRPILDVWLHKFV